MKPTPIVRILAVLAVVIGLLVLMATLANAQTVPATPASAAVQLTDDRGRQITLAHAPLRIVSLLPSLTESVCALGQCARLVGVDRYSNWPDSIAGLPRVGGGIDPSIEAVVALRPDVVLMATSSRASAPLESLGLKVVALEPKTHADVQRVLGKLGQLLAVPDAQQVWRTIDAAMTAAAQSLPATVRSTRVYYEASRGPFGASASSFMGETLTRLGVQNILPPELGPFPKLNPEFVVRANPDLIMVGVRSAAGLTERPGWAGIRAVRERRICEFGVDDTDVLIRPGPRMAEAARLMAQCLADKAPPAVVNRP